ncbi:MAG: SsrA-binding protein SmpB [Thermoanaerobaculia bacterium]
MTTLASNRRARYDYEILDRFEAGIVLQGTEVKSVRAGKVQLREAYVSVRDGEAWLIGAHISPYSHGNRTNHDPDRDRKLLLHRREIDKIYGRTTMQGLTCVPLDVHLKGNKVKVEIALARGKKLHDKREAAREKIQRHEAEEAIGRS